MPSDCTVNLPFHAILSNSGDAASSLSVVSLGAMASGVNGRAHRLTITTSIISYRYRGSGRLATL